MCKWHGAKPFRTVARLREFTEMHHAAGPAKSTYAEAVSWPLWYFILQLSPKKHTSYIPELARRGKRVLDILAQHADQVAQDQKAIDSLIRFRKMWLKAEHGGRFNSGRALLALDGFIRQYMMR